MNEDPDLLRQYVHGKSEAAFAEFVRRHLDFVYACALRRVGGDAQLAEDVAQQVFVAAAREARRLADHPVLSGWLFTTTRNLSVQLVRAERRRRVREQEAQAMNQTDDQSGAWERLRPVLDDALDSLSEADRQAVLLRFFQGKSYAEVGERLRLAENTARMRVDRALDKLNAALARRGVRSTAGALAVALAQQPAIAAPAGLAATVTGAALVGAAGASTTGGAVAVFMGATKLQLATAAAVLAVGAGGLAMQSRTTAALESDLAQARRQADANATIVAENAQLKRDAAERADLARAQDAERLELQRKADALRAQLNPTNTAASPAAAATTARPRSMTIYNVSALDQPPTPISRIPPLYPYEMRRLGVPGEATVDFIVDADGAVQNVKVLKATQPGFGDAAVEAVQRWQFKPGEKDKTAVATHMQVPIVFTLSEPGPSKPKATKPKTGANAPWF